MRKSLGGANLTPDESARQRMFAESSARRWLQAVLLQGNRCLDAANRHRAVIASGSNAVQASDAHGTRLCEEHMFLIALGKALEWLEELARVAPVHRTAMELLSNGAPHARDLRNMREHDAEYFRGEGRRQPAFVHEAIGPDGKLIASVDGSSTLVTGTEYLLGGRLDIHETMRLVEQVLNLLPNPPLSWLTDAESQAQPSPGTA